MTAKPGTVVAAFVFLCQEDTLLLVRQSYGQRYWSLPGGVMEPGESIDQTAIREVKEETGLDIRLGRLIGLYSKPRENALALTFEGLVTGGELRPQHEILEARFFPFSGLPENVRGHFHQRLADFLSRQTGAVVRTQ